MVTTLDTRQVETRQITLEELGEELGIPIKVRPWWGSLRAQPRRVHRECGSELNVYGARDFCPSCHTLLKPEEIELWPARSEWECPGGPTYGRIKRPEVQSGVVIIWEGPCRHPGHTHRQSVKVIDVDADAKAMILRCAASATPSHFLIGMDSGHPFVTPVLRRLTTVQDAFDWLVPNKVREALVLGVDVKRQGDWFFIPTEEPKFWNHRKPFYPHETGVLYRHRALWYGDTTRHTANLIVYKSFLGLPHKAPVVKGDVRAPDHPTLHLETWHVGIRTRSTPGGSRDGPGLD